MKIRFFMAGVAVMALVMVQCSKEHKTVRSPRPVAKHTGSRTNQKQATHNNGNQARAAETKHLGTQEIPDDVRSKCPDYKKITSGGMTTPEGVIYTAYQAVLKKDLQGFIQCFEKYKRPQEIERYYWKNVQKHIAKYTESPNNPAFAVCRRQDAGKDSVKIFVLSKDPKKSHPPIILKKYGNQWKISFFTP